MICLSAKKMRRLAENFYGRIGAYEEALAAEAGMHALVIALGRNVYEDEAAPGALHLAAYIREAAAAFHPECDSNILAGLCAGRVVFPAPEKKREEG